MNYQVNLSGGWVSLRNCIIFVVECKTNLWLNESLLCPTPSIDPFIEPKYRAVGKSWTVGCHGRLTVHGRGVAGGGSRSGPEPMGRSAISRAASGSYAVGRSQAVGMFWAADCHEQWTAAGGGSRAVGKSQATSGCRVVGKSRTAGRSQAASEL